MCEQLGAVLAPHEEEAAFLVGLFSVLDALLDRPMATVLQALPLAESINRALLYHEGLLGTTLGCVLAYERGDWEAAVEPGLPRETLVKAYLDALTWATDTQATLQG